MGSLFQHHLVHNWNLYQRPYQEEETGGFEEEGELLVNGIALHC